jgi:hypothetical protein
MRTRSTSLPAAEPEALEAAAPAAAAIELRPAEALWLGGAASIAAVCWASLATAHLGVLSVGSVLGLAAVMLAVLAVPPGCPCGAAGAGLLLGLVVAAGTRWWPPATLAGAALGVAWLDRPDTLLPVLIASACWQPRRCSAASGGCTPRSRSAWRWSPPTRSGRRSARPAGRYSQAAGGITAGRLALAAAALAVGTVVGRVRRIQQAIRTCAAACPSWADRVADARVGTVGQADMAFGRTEGKLRCFQATRSEGKPHDKPVVHGRRACGRHPHALQ